MFSQLFSEINQGSSGSNSDASKRQPSMTLPSKQTSRQVSTKEPSKITQLHSKNGSSSSTMSTNNPNASSKKPVLSLARDTEQEAKVARLKAERAKLRQQELEAKRAKRVGATTSARTTQTRAQSSIRTTNSSVGLKPASRVSKVSKDSYVEPKKAPAKKLNFKEIMKQAESIDTDKLKVTVKVRDHKAVRPQQQRESVSVSPESTTNIQKTKDTTTRTLESATKERSKHIYSGSAPLAKPMPGLAEKYRKKKELAQQRIQNQSRNHRYDRGDDMDDFIDDDNDNEEPSLRTSTRKLGYDPDEIWAIFNPGKKREFYDNFSDDDIQEATGEEIFGEEKRSAMVGRLEDLKEEERLRKLQKQKRAAK